MTEYDRQVKGRVNRAEGLVFERLIEGALVRYAEQGIAVIKKTPEPMKVIRRLNGGRFEACFEQKADPDYKGCLAPDGREVIFDAKLTVEDKISRSRVTDRQAEALEAHLAAGAICFVLVGFALGGQALRVYRVPWVTWRDMGEVFGRKHIKLADLENSGMPFDYIEERYGIRFVPLVAGVPLLLAGIRGT